MHHLSNFKGFKYAEIDLFRPMTLLVGRNGAGKSNLIEAVELLAELANGRPLHEITEVGRGSGNSFEIRGGLSGCMRKEGEGRCHPFRLGFSGRNVNANSNIHYYIEVDHIPSEILNEELTCDEKKYFQAALQKGSNDILEVTYNNFSRGGNNPSTQISANSSVLSRYDLLLSLLYDKRGAKKSVDEAKNNFLLVRDYLKSAYVFDFHPRLMRQYESVSAYILNKQGSNLSAVLYAIKQEDDAKDEAEQLLPRILAILKQLPEEPYSAFEFLLHPPIMCFSR